MFYVSQLWALHVVIKRQFFYTFIISSFTVLDNPQHSVCQTFSSVQQLSVVGHLLDVGLGSSFHRHHVNNRVISTSYCVIAYINNITPFRYTSVQSEADGLLIPHIKGEKIKKAPQGGWRSSPPACTACCGLPAITITTYSGRQHGDTTKDLVI